MSTRNDYLSNVKRIVIKIGSSTLTYPTGLLNFSRIEKLVRQIADINNRGIEVILVSSGAVAAGIGKLGLKSRPKTIPEKQAAAAVGQGILIHMYEKILSEYGKIAAQMLLTKDDMSERKRFLNIRNAFFSLLESNVIPIVNENDAVIVDEIKFGDNDTLSAMVTGLVEADLLIILSDIKGLYDSNPKLNPDAKLINNVYEITDEIISCAGGAGSNLGTGGMITKLNAAKIASTSGASMIIVDGSEENILSNVIEGNNVGTFFFPDSHKLNARKHWIAYNTNPSGYIIIDNGAEKAIINNHKSLLPKGITNIEGDFQEGDVVSILNSNKQCIANGITNFSSLDIKNIKGLNSNEIELKLGYKSYHVVVHTNNMVIL
ncbi:glutamate 5-kinase [Clostridium sediminicola]|uniref:glutamate 5-kinase n=1 Tax=Clostridium sediminicola TaxID=3114879 RepID=UPI003D169A8C